MEEYIDLASRKSELERTELQKEKTGVFSGCYAKNPVNGEVIPIWIADYVLGRCVWLSCSFGFIAYLLIGRFVWAGVTELTYNVWKGNVWLILHAIFSLLDSKHNLILWPFLVLEVLE